MKQSRKILSLLLSAVLLTGLLSGCTGFAKQDEESSQVSAILIDEASQSKAESEASQAESSAAESSAAESSAAETSDTNTSVSESSADSSTAESSPSEESSKTGDTFGGAGGKKNEESSQAASAESSTPSQESSVPSDALAGTVIYKLIYLSEGDESFDESMMQVLEKSGLVTYLYFFADGTGRLELYSEEEPQVFTWDQEKLVADGEEIPYTIENDILTMSEESENITMQFRRLSDADALIVLNGGTPTADKNSQPILIPQEYHEVLLDEEDFTVEVTGFSMDSFTFNVHLNLVNKDDETLVFSAANASMEGLMAYGDLFATLQAGETRAETLGFDANFVKNHIEAFPTWIEFELNVYEADDYDDVYLNYVDIYPAGEDQALQISFHPDDTDQVLVDNDYVTIIYSLDAENTLESFYDYSIPLVVVNKTETPLLLNAGTSVLNSSETDILYADTIAPYCMKYSTVGWSAEDLTKASISSTDVKTITLTMRFLADHTLESLGEEEFTIQLR